MTPEGLALIKKWEGCKLTSYLDSVGVWTIGYGTTTNAGLGSIAKGMTITQARADDMLTIGLAKYVNEVSRAIGITPVTPFQFDAMTALCYNIGQGAFKGSSVARFARQGRFDEAADAFLLWNKGTVKGRKTVIQGLVNRRHAERALFIKPYTASVVATPPVKPNLWTRLMAYFRN